MARETTLNKQVLLATSRAGSTLFKVNPGQAWQGQITDRTDHSITLYRPRPIRSGLPEGTSDLLGWTPVTITAEMVGSTIAVFTAIEDKIRPQRPTMQQLHFIEVVKHGGGRAGIAYSVIDALNIIRGMESISELRRSEEE